jgi:hypothetical protein
MVLPPPGVMLSITPSYVPPMLKGMKVDPKNPFSFDFILDSGNAHLQGQPLKEEADDLIKYFLASLTIPENDLWVNLSPYEKQRIIPNKFGLTEMGRDLLAEDYILKQLTASLIYPEKELGKEFWKKIYLRAKQLYGTESVPVNTFNKVWILPDKAVVYQHQGAVYIVDSHLKVMLEEDYLSLKNHTQIGRHALGSQIIREIVLPELEKEVNHGQNFSRLRQIYASLILAKWYKQTLRQSILNHQYSDQKKISGLEVGDALVKEKIYQQYLKAFKIGVFNYIKEDYDSATQTRVPRKYFSGGMQMWVPLEVKTDADSAMHGIDEELAASNSNQTYAIIGNFASSQTGPVVEPSSAGVIAIFLKKMDSPDPEVRLSGIKILDILIKKGIADPQFISEFELVDKLMKALKDENYYVRMSAIEVLSYLSEKDEGVKTRLISFIKSALTDGVVNTKALPEAISFVNIIADHVDIAEAGVVLLDIFYQKKAELIKLSNAIKVASSSRGAVSGEMAKVPAMNEKKQELLQGLTAIIGALKNTLNKAGYSHRTAVLKAFISTLFDNKGEDVVFLKEVTSALYYAVEKGMDRRPIIAQAFIKVLNYENRENWGKFHRVFYSATMGLRFCLNNGVTVDQDGIRALVRMAGYRNDHGVRQEALLGLGDAMAHNIDIGTRGIAVVLSNLKESEDVVREAAAKAAAEGLAKGGIILSIKIESFVQMNFWAKHILEDLRKEHIADGLLQLIVNPAVRKESRHAALQSVGYFLDKKIYTDERVAWVELLMQWAVNADKTVDKDLRVWSIEALSHIQKEDTERTFVFNALTKIADDEQENVEVRNGSIHALAVFIGQDGAEGVLKVFTEILNRNAFLSVRQEIASRLSAVAGRGANMGTDAIRALIAFDGEDSSEYVHQQLIYALSNCLLHGIDIGEEGFKVLQKVLQDENDQPDFRMKAAQALLVYTLKKDGGFKAYIFNGFREIFRNPKEFPQLRAEVIAGVGIADSTYLMDVVNNDKDDSYGKMKLRQAAIRKLSEMIEVQGVIEFLVKIAIQGPPALRIEALKGLDKALLKGMDIGIKGIMLLFETMGDKDNDLRQTAAAILDSQQAKEWLLILTARKAAQGEAIILDQNWVNAKHDENVPVDRIDPEVHSVLNFISHSIEEGLPDDPVRQDQFLQLLVGIRRAVERGVPLKDVSAALLQLPQSGSFYTNGHDLNGVQVNGKGDHFNGSGGHINGSGHGWTTIFKGPYTGIRNAPHLNGGPTLNPDKAMTSGGIDLNPNSLDLDTHGQSQDFNVSSDGNVRIQTGLFPMITQINPTSIHEFLN